jgi:hypothetical protein
LNFCKETPVIIRTLFDRELEMPMGKIGARAGRYIPVALMAVSVWLVAGSARAVPIMSYITVQPIDVCSGAAGTTTGCAPINSFGQNYAAAPVGQIGSIVSGINVTRAIWNQIGLDITFLPAVQYPNAANYLNLTVDTGSVPLTSTPFKSLSDQDNIASGGIPFPAPPLSQNPSTVNMFFVNQLIPTNPPGGTLYGFAWIDNNGVAVAANSLLGFGARPDTIAHELGHNFNLDHTTFGAGPNGAGVCDATCAANLMTAGGLRALSTSANVLNNLASGKADQLNDLQREVVLDPTGFKNPIPGVTATVTPPNGETGPFHVSFDTEGRPGSFLGSLTLTAPAGITFLNGSFDVTNASPGLDGKITAHIEGCGQDPHCQAGTLVLTFAPGVFVQGQAFDFDVTVCPLRGQCGGRADLLLEGGTYTYLFETDGLVDGTTVALEKFQTTSTLIPVDGLADLLSSSWSPDPMIPSQILNPTTFVGFYSQPCTVDTACPVPVELRDADPIEEGTVPEPSSIVILAPALAMFSAIWWRRDGRFTRSRPCAALRENGRRLGGRGRAG